MTKDFLDYFEDFKMQTFRWRNYPSEGELKDFEIFFRTKVLGKLNLPTGKIVASDPFVYFDEKPFITKIESGSYDVILSLARINHEDERVAFAMLKFNENLPIRWELALRETDDISKLIDGQFFGFGVDSGTGCFIDAQSQIILNKLLEDQKFDEFLVNEMQKTFVNTRDWVNYTFENHPNNNLIAFSSGWGDGHYASYFGYDENNQVVCLVTDFEVVRDSEK